MDIADFISKDLPEYEHTFLLMSLLDLSTSLERITNSDNLDVLQKHNALNAAIKVIEAHRGGRRWIIS